jgi:hypothetical protein
MKPSDEYLGNLKEERINHTLTESAKIVSPYLPICPKSCKNPNEIPLFQTGVNDKNDVNLIDLYSINKFSIAHDFVR